MRIILPLHQRIITGLFWVLALVFSVAAFSETQPNLSSADVTSTFLNSTGNPTTQPAITPIPAATAPIKAQPGAVIPPLPTVVTKTTQTATTQPAPVLTKPIPPLQKSPAPAKNTIPSISTSTQTIPSESAKPTHLTPTTPNKISPVPHTAATPAAAPKPAATHQATNSTRLDVAPISNPASTPAAAPLNPEIQKALNELRDQNMHLAEKLNQLNEQVSALHKTVVDNKNIITKTTQKSAEKSVSASTAATASSLQAAAAQELVSELSPKPSQPAALNAKATVHPNAEKTTASTPAATTTPVTKTEAANPALHALGIKPAPQTPANETTIAPPTSASPTPTANTTPPIAQPSQPLPAIDKIAPTNNAVQPIIQKQTTNNVRTLTSKPSKQGQSTILGWAIALISAALGLLVWLFWPKEESVDTDNTSPELESNFATDTVPEPESSPAEYKPKNEFWDNTAEDVEEQTETEEPEITPSRTAGSRQIEPTPEEVEYIPSTPEHEFMDQSTEDDAGEEEEEEEEEHNPEYTAPQTTIAEEPITEPDEQEATSAETTTETEEHDEEYDFMDAEEAIAVKLDLARAYLEMGDYADVEFTLQSVLKSGTDNQKQEAQLLLEQAKLAQSQ